MTSKSIEKNPKVRTTSIIWAMATGMLGICVPLVAITNSGLTLPLAVILGASGSTAIVWLVPDPRDRQATRLHQSIKGLEERVANLETICCSPDFAPQKMLPLGQKREG